MGVGGAIGNKSKVGPYPIGIIAMGSLLINILCGLRERSESKEMRFGLGARVEHRGREELTTSETSADENLIFRVFT